MLKQGRDYIANMYSYTKNYVDEAKGIEAYYLDDTIDGDKLRVSVTKYKDNRINMDQVKAYVDDWIEQGRKLAKGMVEYIPLQEDDGIMVLMLKMHMPKIMSDRACIIAMYRNDHDDCIEYVVSDRGNEKLYE